MLVQRKALTYALIALALFGLIVWRVLGVSDSQNTLWWWLLLLWGTAYTGIVQHPLNKSLFPGMEHPEIVQEPARLLKDHEALALYYPVSVIVIGLSAYILSPLLFSGATSLFTIKSMHFWWASVLSGILNVGIFYFFNKGMRYGDVSVVSTAWGFNPVIVLPVSFIVYAFVGGVVTSPTVSTLGFVGIVLVVGAIFVNGATQKKTTPTTPPKGDWFAHHPFLSGLLGAGIIAPIAVNFDKVAVDAGNPFLAGMVTFATASVITLAWTMVESGWKRISYLIHVYRKELLVMGVAFAISNIAFNVTLYGQNINYYAAIKRSTVLWSTLYGIFMLREGGDARNKRIRLLVSLVLFLGVVLIIAES